MCVCVCVCVCVFVCIYMGVYIYTCMMCSRWMSLIISVVEKLILISMECVYKVVSCVCVCACYAWMDRRLSVSLSVLCLSSKPTCSGNEKFRRVLRGTESESGLTNGCMCASDPICFKLIMHLAKAEMHAHIHASDPCIHRYI
jgi:hypothetical protein